MTFDPKKSIDFLGQTGPYCLYAYARVQSLLRKADQSLEATEWNADIASCLTSPLEQAVIRALQAVPGTFLWAAETGDTSKIANQTYKVAKAFSALYNDKGHQIVGTRIHKLEKPDSTWPRAWPMPSRRVCPVWGSTPSIECNPS